MITSQNSLNIATFLALMGYSLFIALPVSPLFAGAGYDREVFKYVGMVVDQGGSPYIDVFDHKPPLIYLITAFGGVFGIWGFWLLERFVTGLAGFIFVLWLKNNKFKGSIGISFIFITLSILPSIYQGGGLTRNFSACFNLVSFCIISSSLKEKYLMAGSLAGATFMLQQNEIFPVCGWLITWVLLFEDKSKNLKAILAFITGSLVSIIPLIIFFWLKGSISGFIDQAFIFNFTYISNSSPLWDRATKLLRDSLELGLFIPGFFVFLIVFVVRIFKRKNTQADRFLLPCLAAFAGQLVAISLSGLFLPHYFLGLIPILVIFLAIALEEVHEIRPILFPITLFFFFLFSVPVTPFIASISESFRGIANITQRAEYDRINDDFRQYLAPLSGQPGQLFVFRNTFRLHLNTNFKIISPSKFIYTHLYENIPNWDNDGILFDSIILDIKMAKSRYILDYSKINPIRKDLQKEWDDFLSSTYLAVKSFPDNGILYVLNVNPGH